MAAVILAGGGHVLSAHADSGIVDQSVLQSLNPAQAAPAQPPPSSPSHRASKITVHGKVPVPGHKPEPDTAEASPPKMQNDVALSLNPAIPPPAPKTAVKIPAAPVPARPALRVAADGGIQLKGKAAGPKMPAVPSEAVVAEPLPGSVAAPPPVTAMEKPHTEAVATKTEITMAKTDTATMQKTAASGMAPPPVLKPVPGSTIPAAVPVVQDITAAAPAPALAGVPRPPVMEAGSDHSFTIPFKPGANQLDAQVTAALQAHILPLLRNNPSWRLRIEAFASPVDKEPMSARRVSLGRAMEVRSWLMDKGIEARRMDLRALGTSTDQAPADRVDLRIDPDLERGG